MFCIINLFTRCSTTQQMGAGPAHAAPQQSSSPPEEGGDGGAPQELQLNHQGLEQIVQESKQEQQGAPLRCQVHVQTIPLLAPGYSDWVCFLS